MIIGASNRPEDLDDAVWRWLDKWLYVPLPNADGRRMFLNQHLIRLEKDQIKCFFSDEEKEEFVKMTKGYSGADLWSLC